MGPVHRYDFCEIVNKIPTLSTFNFYTLVNFPGEPGGGGLLPYIGYIGMCGPKGYGLSAVLVMVPNFSVNVRIPGAVRRTR